MADTLDTFQAITIPATTDLMHVKSGTGANSDKKVTFANVEASLRHDFLSGFSADRHTDWGGTTRNFSTSGTLACGVLTATTGAFTGDVTINAGNVAVDSGKGVDFSLTADATGSTSELFDDHEKGTFTATLEGAGGGGTPIPVTGNYTINADKVTAWCTFSNKDTSGMTGALQITGFPYASAATIYGLAWLASIVTSTTGSVARIGGGGTTINLLSQTANGAQAISAGTGRYLAINITYRV